MASQSNRRHLAASVALLLGSSIQLVDGFVVSQRTVLSNKPTRSFVLPYASTSAGTSLYANPGADEEQQQVSFSRRSESPLGVRRRVKAVLAKAKSRTGISNSSSEEVRGQKDERQQQASYRKINTQQTASSIVADAASIGGLGDGSVEVALEYQALATTSTTRFNGVKDPASTMSPVIKNKRNPEEVLVLSDSPLREKRFSTAEVDAIRADVPAAYADPLPFTLPTLTQNQKGRLEAGERIQEQSKMGGEGSGYVVLDVKAPPYVVWECLLDFESYPTTIPTVRDVRFFSSENLKSGYVAEKPIDPSTGRELRRYGSPSTTRAAFILSKFRLNIAAIHNYRPHPDGHYMDFTLDPECTNVVLQSAKGIWHTQTNPDGRGEVSSIEFYGVAKMISKLITCSFPFSPGMDPSVAHL